MLNYYKYLFILFFSCTGISDSFKVESVDHEIFVDISDLDSRKFRCIEANKYEGFSLFKDYIDHIDIMIHINSNKHGLDYNLSEESRFTKTYLDSNHYAIQLNNSYALNEIVMQRLFIDKIKVHKLDSDRHKYIVTFNYLLLDKNKTVNVQIKKEFDSYNIVSFYSWATKFNRIKILEK